jgi:hypothetical protein
MGALEDSGNFSDAAGDKRILSSRYIQDERGRTGRPDQAFSNPRISRTTESASCVLRHQ